jgi:hypothetical protein
MYKNTCLPKKNLKQGKSYVKYFLNWKPNHFLFHAFSQNGETHSALIPIPDSVDNIKVLSNRIGALAAGGEAADCRVNSQVFKNDEKISSSDKCKNCHCKNGQVSVLFVFMSV